MNKTAELTENAAALSADSNPTPKHLHVIGICGVAMSALAIAFHKKGWLVTGSDKGFYPPVSTELESAGVSFYAGWHPEKMIEKGIPDLIVIGTASGRQNPETEYAIEHNIPRASYAEIFRDHLIKKNSIVCVGTWGKTSSSAMLSFILERAEMNPSYMFGGISLAHKSSARLTDGDWSVIEGDEYKVSPDDSTAKFFYYKPTHLLLTSVSWDHADIYPTEEDYFKTFGKLINGMSNNDNIVACIDDAGVQRILKETDTATRAITYGQSANAMYRYHSVSHTSDGLTFSIDHKDVTYQIVSPLLGRYNVENITGCFAMAHHVGIDANLIVTAIADFKGIKRRLEKRLDGKITVLDCHAPTPEKAAYVLASIREVYHKKITAIFEPNIGGRQRASIAKYDDAFKDVDTLILPRFTKLKIDPDAIEAPLEAVELAEYISAHATATKKDAGGKTTILQIDDDTELVTTACADVKPGDVIAFLGSHGFRGMIEQTITSLHQQSL